MQIKLNNTGYISKSNNNYENNKKTVQHSSNISNNTSFGMKNPQNALLRAQKLKAMYAKAGIKYLLPNEVWSTKKIMQTIDKVIESYDKLLESGKKITVNDLNKIVEKFLPKKFAKEIKIKDFHKDLPIYMKSVGYSKDDINNYLKNFLGITVTTPEKSIIYTNLNPEDTMFSKINSEVTFVHELKHAITSRTTNIKNYSSYNIKNKLKLSNLFNELESIYRINPQNTYQHLDITDNNLYKNLLNTSTEKRLMNKKEFKYDFFGELEKIFIKNPDLNEIDVLKFFKLKAKDEKEAYTTNKIFRKLNPNVQKPFGIELRGLIYKEFEKFFSEAKKHYEKTQNK